MGIIDVHTHINHGVVNDTVTNDIYMADLDGLYKIGLVAGIDRMFCSTFASVLSCENVAAENEYLYQLCQSVDYLYQWVVIEPRTEETFEQAKRMLNTKKCVGIKLHPPFHKYSYDDYGDRIFSLADEYGAIVLIHPWREAELILPYADKYPNATFIMAHLGGASHVNAIEKSVHGNVYTDVATAASTNNNVIEYAVNRIGSERILFGTDTYSAGFVRGRIDYALISDKDKENILVNNAEKLFNRFLKNQ